jgi:hypothetical protein
MGPKEGGMRYFNGVFGGEGRSLYLEFGLGMIRVNEKQSLDYILG